MRRRHHRRRHSGERRGSIAFAIIQSLVEEVLIVEEETIERAVVALIEIEKTVAEGAGAAGLAACCSIPRASPASASAYRSREANRQPRARFGADARPRAARAPGAAARNMTDVSGSLATVATVIAEAGGNIVEIQHQRLRNSSVRSPEVEFLSRRATASTPMRGALAADKGVKVSAS